MIDTIDIKLGRFDFASPLHKIFLFPMFSFSKLDVYIISRPESELTDTYTILMENLYHVSSALNAMELTLKNSSSGSSSGGAIGGVSGGTSKDTVDIITTL